MEGVSDIKLIRTDTTLDLSQKAEKRYSFQPKQAFCTVADLLTSGPPTQAAEIGHSINNTHLQPCTHLTGIGHVRRALPHTDARRPLTDNTNSQLLPVQRFTTF